MERTGLNYEDYWKEVEELHKETKTADADLDEDSQKQEVKGRIYNLCLHVIIYNRITTKTNYTVPNYMNYNVIILQFTPKLLYFLE